MPKIIVVGTVYCAECKDMLIGNWDCTTGSVLLYRHDGYNNTCSSRDEIYRVPFTILEVEDA